MKFLADESLEARLVEFLREQGHDVLFVAELSRGIPDTEVLALANGAARVLLTNDKDFGELTFLQRQAHHGIVLRRFQTESLAIKQNCLSRLLQARATVLPTSFTVVTERQIRVRRLGLAGD
jgi:predicted nuclease of predicted toxin-antitoxin system